MLGTLARVFPDVIYRDPEQHDYHEQGPDVDNGAPDCVVDGIAQHFTLPAKNFRRDYFFGNCS